MSMMVDPAKKWWPPNGYLSRWIVDQFPSGYRGYAIDVGASDGVSINTTFTLEKTHNWTVVSVEPNSVFHPYLIAQRAMVEKCACDSTSGEAVLHVYQPNEEAYSALRPNKKKPDQPGPWDTMVVKVKTLEEIIAQWEFPRLDALCIDVEGNEIDVLKGCDLEKWRPRAVIAECWDGPDGLQDFLGPAYKLCHRSVDNYCFLREAA